MKSVVWNGPMGVFEMKPLQPGLLLLRKLLQTWMRQLLSAAENPLPLWIRWGLKISSLMCLLAAALLEMLEGMVLPGVAVLADKE